MNIALCLGTVGVYVVKEMLEEEEYLNEVMSRRCLPKTQKTTTMASVKHYYYCYSTKPADLT